jgi:hypothetical protein
MIYETGRESGEREEWLKIAKFVRAHWFFDFGRIDPKSLKENIYIGSTIPNIVKPDRGYE